MHHQTVKLAEAENLAKKIAPELKGGEVLALVGPLGSGKTTFTKALAKNLKIRHTVTSPTFIIMNRYEGQLKNRKKIFLYHLDLYRTKNFREVKALGLTEIWNTPQTITVIEWADKIKRYLPKDAFVITFCH